MVACVDGESGLRLGQVGVGLGETCEAAGDPAWVKRAGCGGVTQTRHGRMLYDIPLLSHRTAKRADASGRVIGKTGIGQAVIVSSDR